MSEQQPATGRIAPETVEGDVRPAPAASGAGAEMAQRIHDDHCGDYNCNGRGCELKCAVEEALRRNSEWVQAAIADRAAATARADRAEAALTEARSAALREAAERIATLEPVCTGGSYSYAAGFMSGLDAAEIELGRMAGGAEDTSTDRSATPDREQG